MPVFNSSDTFAANCDSICKVKYWGLAALQPDELGPPTSHVSQQRTDFWFFFLRGQEDPPNSAEEPLAVVGQDIILGPAVGQVSRLDRRDCPPLRLLRKSLYSILYWGLGVLGAGAAELEGAGAGVLMGAGEHCLDDAGLAMTS